MPKRPPTETVAARFDIEALKQIDQARESFGDSRGDYVRRVVTTAVNQDQGSEQTQQFEELRMSVANLEVSIQNSNRAMRRMMYALLATSGNVSDEEAHGIARKLFDKDQQ